MNSYEEFRTGPFNVQLIVFNNTNIILYTLAVVKSCVVIYCMMCTFRGYDKTTND